MNEQTTDTPMHRHLVVTEVEFTFKGQRSMRRFQFFYSCPNSDLNANQLAEMQEGGAQHLAQALGPEKIKEGGLNIHTVYIMGMHYLGFSTDEDFFPKKEEEAANEAPSTPALKVVRNDD